MLYYTQLLLQGDLSRDNIHPTSLRNSDICSKADSVWLQLYRTMATLSGSPTQSYHHIQSDFYINPCRTLKYYICCTTVVEDNMYSTGARVWPQLYQSLTSLLWSATRILSPSTLYRRLSYTL